MKTKFLTTVLLMFCAIKFSAQEVKKYLYKGYIDKYPVMLYLRETKTECGTINYQGMYKYDTSEKWLWLDISDDEQSQLIMVEEGASGIISAKKSPDALKGFWISPDGAKKYNLNLKEIPTPNKIMESYDLKYDYTISEADKC